MVCIYNLDTEGDIYSRALLFSILTFCDWVWWIGESPHACFPLPAAFTQITLGSFKFCH